MTLWLILTVALASVAWFAVWARYPSKARWLAVLAFLFASPAAGASLLLSMGWPVPLYPYISTPEGDLEVLGVKLVPEQAIYVMLDVGQERPRTFSLPWNAEKASKLQRMMEGAEGEGKIKIKMKAEGNHSPGEFYMDAPPVIVPEKPKEAPGIVFEGEF